MSLLDLLKTIGDAKPGTRGIVCEEIEVVNLGPGGTLRLPIGTHFEIRCATGGSVSATAALNGRLEHVGIFSRDYHKVELKPRT